jgi:putative transposase
MHARVANVRADALHKATSRLAANYETVIVEDLNVTGMIASKKLARVVSDQGFGTARRMLTYKTARNGGALLVADRWYPSSKTCSDCGSVKAKLTLKDRIFRLRCLRAHRGPGRERGPEPFVPRRQWGGEAERARSGGKTRPGRAHRAETRTRHPPAAGKTGTVPQQCEAAV